MDKNVIIDSRGWRALYWTVKTKSNRNNILSIVFVWWSGNSFFSFYWWKEPPGSIKYRIVLNLKSNKNLMVVGERERGNPLAVFAALCWRRFEFKQGVSSHCRAGNMLVFVSCPSFGWFWLSLWFDPVFGSEKTSNRRISPSHTACLPSRHRQPPSCPLMATSNTSKFTGFSRGLCGRNSVYCTCSWTHLTLISP